jgi:DNA-binding transcriptional LysR family regulator
MPAGSLCSRSRLRSRISHAALDLGALATHRHPPERYGSTRRPFAARAIISPLVLEFLRRYPDMHVDVVTEGKMVDIVKEGFDLGVRVAGLVPSDMIAVSLGRPQRHAVVGSPEYFEQHGKPMVPPDLLKHRCIRVRLPDGSLFRWRFEKDGEPVQIDVRGPITLDEASLDEDCGA